MKLDRRIHLLFDIYSKMADPDAVHIRSPEKVNITVLRARNMRGSKTDAVQITIKYEFGEKTLGESTKVDIDGDTPTDINHSTTMNCTYDDPQVLDEMAHKPVVLTVIEVLPKEKKQKEEKTINLGQCSVDLLPLVRGITNHECTLTVHPFPGSPLEQIPPENPKPELDILLSVNEPLLDDTQLNAGNLMTISLESMFSPPDGWTITGTPHGFAGAIPIPVNSEKEVPIVFANGQLKPIMDREVANRQKKWPMPGTAQGNAIYIPEKSLPVEPIEDEDGDFKSKEDRDHRNSSEQEKPRVIWNTERRCYMEGSSVKSFQDKIAKCRYWPVEVMRLPQAAGTKGKKEDEGSMSFHGIVFLNLAPLLYPGVQRIRGAYRIYAYSDQALMDKTKRKSGIGEEAARIAVNILNRNSGSPFPKKTGKEKEGEKKEKEVKKGASQTMKSDTGSDVDGHAISNPEGHQYVEAKSYLMIEVTLAQPLVPKRPPEELARRVAEYIPPRPLFPKRKDGALRAVEDFHDQVASVASTILDEFRNMFGEELKDGKGQTPEQMEARRQKLIYEMNSTGKYFAFKEQLKHAVVKIVREKYLKTSNFEDRQELQTFLSELYVYLIDQMHVSLGKNLALEDQPPVPEPLTDSGQLKHFAREAEVNGNFELATKYYQERIARNKNDPSHWLDYGTFCLYINDITKAEECFKECIAVDQKHLEGLMLYGVVCTLSERHEAAETFFEAATRVDPKSILAWTMLGLFYDSVNNEIGAEMAYLEASKMNQGAAVAKAKLLREAEAVDRHSESDRPNTADAQKDGDTLNDQGGLAPIQDTKVSQVPPSPTSSDKTPSSARSGQKQPSAKSLSGSRRSAKQKSEVSMSRPPSQMRPSSHRVTPQPAEEPEELPPREPTPVPTSSIYMQAIDWLLEVKAIPFTERSLAHELLLPTGGPTAIYHIAYARLKLQKHELDEAEESLNEAMQFDHQNPDAWALMGHVKYMAGDTDSARECYEHTISFIADATETHSIYLRLASIYLQDGKFQDAKKTFLMACKRSPSCVSWLGVGISCYRLGELAEAEDALSEANILNNSDPEVWGYLSLVCLKTTRQLEAEQAYKYALKLNLSDPELLADIQTVQREVGFGNPSF
ncbi:hypothetical protein ScPMuIL_014304 [Solemya velum]